MLTDDKDNSDLLRIVIRGSSHKRPRPQNSRFGGGPLAVPLAKRGVQWNKDGVNWIGKSWMK